MLVISRKKGETFVLSGGIEISIVDIGGDRVRIGIEAPKEIKVLRQELTEIVKENKQAAAAPAAVHGLSLGDLGKALKTAPPLMDEPRKNSTKE